MLSGFIHSSVSIAFKQGSPITVIPFDLEHHKGNILLIFSVGGFNRPPSKYDGSSGMWFYFIFFKMHRWPWERELQYLQSVTMETFTICTWCNKACELVNVARALTACSVQALPYTLAKIMGNYWTLSKSQVLKDITFHGESLAFVSRRSQHWRGFSMCVSVCLRSTVPQRPTIQPVNAFFIYFPAVTRYPLARSASGVVTNRERERG